MISNPLYKFLLYFIAGLLSIFSLIFLTGCNSQKKFIKYATTHKEELAELCVENFKPELKYIKGDTDTIIKVEYKDNPVLVPCPPVVAMSGETVIAYVKCPPYKIINNTITRIDTIEVNNPEKEFLLQSKLTESEKEAKKFKDRRDGWRKTALITIVTLVVLGVYYVMIGRK